MVINQLDLYHGTMHGKAILRKYPFKHSHSEKPHVYTKWEGSLFQELLPY